MPELPEVETVAVGLRARLVGERIVGVIGSGFSLRQPVDLQRLRRDVAGRRVLRVERYGKYLLVHVEAGRVLLAHLGMTGRMEVAEAGGTRPHTHLRFPLESGAELRFVDPRRFGLVRSYGEGVVRQSPELRDLGPDPMGPGFTPDGLYQAVHRSRRRVRDVLLDQHVVAGVGNIYASEACFLAGLHPARRGDRITRKQAAALYRGVHEALRQAIRNRGTSFRDYVDVEGQRGGNQQQLNVYGREGLPCLRCGAAVRRLVLGARSAFFCLRCQPR